MFHTLLTLSYTIPGIYLFFRIWSLFIEKKNRLVYVVIFAFVFSIYPISNLIGEDRTGMMAKILGTVSSYLLPFFLYLFLLILLTDILLLINSLLQFVTGHKLKKNFPGKWIFYLILFLSAAIVIAGIINFNTIRISRYEVNIPPGSSKLGKFRIAFISDFHLQERTSLRFVGRFVKKTGEIDPDIMLFGGDIIEGDREDENMIRIEKMLSTIRPAYGVYGVPGNHEHYSRRDRSGFFSRSGIEMLSDTVIVIDHLFALAGRDDARTSTRKSADELASMAPDSLPLIMLDHRPTEIDQISKTSADIVLSGHTHDGQLFPINLITRKIYRISYGYLQVNNTHFFVSSGLRLWGPPVRTTARSEIVVVDITLK